MSKLLENLAKLKDILAKNIGDEEKKIAGTELCDSMMDHLTRKRWYAKMLALVNFRNVIMILAVVVGVLLVCAVAWDIVSFLGTLAIDIIIKLLSIVTNHNLIGAVGIGVAVITIYYKVSDFEHTYLKYLFVFDTYTPLFGCFIIFLTTCNWYNCQTAFESDLIVHFFLIGVFATAATYHQNWFIGVLPIHMIFDAVGFRSGTMPGGYFAGFTEIDPAIRCLVVSLLLVGTFIGLEINNMNHSYVKVFETGVYFWGTFIGCLAMLILSDYHYVGYKHWNATGRWFTLQILMCGLCLTVMYFGYMLNKSNLKGIGGTFLVLWLMDVERIVVWKLETYNTTGILFLLLINLLGIYYYIKKYPQYFIL